ncbi:MAG: hypothetical protein IKB70_12615, partial [Bacilli bacterium]|nr:hypothetical protein [Bacilli bacterium]MBR7117875.1 hypothetical protein [Helicobacteraceae bacterium]
TAINATNTNANAKDSNMQDNIASQETHTAKENEAMMILEIIRKWEYRNKQSNDNIYDTTKPTVSKFTLRKNSEVLKGYIIEPNGPDSIKSGQHKRIPIGKYKAKWHLSSLKLDNGSYRARRVDLPTQQTNKFSKIVLCCDSRCKHKAKRHSHIIPLLYNENVPEWRGILIHIGSKRTDTDGCLLPGFELNDSDNPTEFQAGSTTNATAELLMQIIMHDEVSYQKQIEIPNFEIVIKEEYNNE